MGRDISVGIAPRYGLDATEIEYRLGARFSAPLQTDPGTYPTSHTIPEVKGPVRGVDHSPPSSAEVN